MTTTQARYDMLLKAITISEYLMPTDIEMDYNLLNCSLSGMREIAAERNLPIDTTTEGKSFLCITYKKGVEIYLWEK